MMGDQAPNIDLSGRGGRLVYDKTRKLIVASEQQQRTQQPGGWPRVYPYNTFARRIREAWWVLTGQWSLHVAWQNGYDQHIMDESARRANGGR